MKYKHILLIPLAAVLATAVASDDHLRGSTGHRAINKYDDEDAGFAMEEDPSVVDTYYPPPVQEIKPALSQGSDCTVPDGRNPKTHYQAKITSLKVAIEVIDKNIQKGNLELSENLLDAVAPKVMELNNCFSQMKSPEDVGLAQQTEVYSELSDNVAELMESLGDAGSSYLSAKYPDFDEAGYENEEGETTSGEAGVKEDVCKDVHSGMTKEEIVKDVEESIAKIEEYAGEGDMGTAQMYDDDVAFKLMCMEKDYKNNDTVSDLKTKYEAAKGKLQKKDSVSFQQEEENSGNEPPTEDNEDVWVNSGNESPTEDNEDVGAPVTYDPPPVNDETDADTGDSTIFCPNIWEAVMYYEKMEEEAHDEIGVIEDTIIVDENPENAEKLIKYETGNIESLVYCYEKLDVSPDEKEKVKHFKTMLEMLKRAIVCEKEEQVAIAKAKENETPIPEEEKAKIGNCLEAIGDNNVAIELLNQIVNFEKSKQATDDSENEDVVEEPSSDVKNKMASIKGALEQIKGEICNDDVPIETNEDNLKTVKKQLDELKEEHGEKFGIPNLDYFFDTVNGMLQDRKDGKLNCEMQNKLGPEQFKQVVDQLSKAFTQIEEEIDGGNANLEEIWGKLGPMGEGLYNLEQTNGQTEEIMKLWEVNQRIEMKLEIGHMTEHLTEIEKVIDGEDADLEVIREDLGFMGKELEEMVNTYGQTEAIVKLQKEYNRIEGKLPEKENGGGTPDTPEGGPVPGDITPDTPEGGPVPGDITPDTLEGGPVPDTTEDGGTHEEAEALVMEALEMLAESKEENKEDEFFLQQEANDAAEKMANFHATVAIENLHMKQVQDSIALDQEALKDNLLTRDECEDNIKNYKNKLNYAKELFESVQNDISSEEEAGMIQVEQYDQKEDAQQVSDELTDLNNEIMNAENQIKALTQILDAEKEEDKVEEKDEVEGTKEVEDLDKNDKIAEALLEVGFDPEEIEKVIAKVASVKEDEAIELNEEEKAELKEVEDEFRQ